MATDLTPKQIDIIPAKIKIVSDELDMSERIGGISTNADNVSRGTGDEVYKLDSQGLYLGASAFASAPFSVDYNGALTASSATITGSVTATSGAIGGWTITATEIKSASSEIVLDSNNKKITVGTSQEITIDGTNKKIESSNYVSGMAGAGFYLDSNLLEVGNISARGLIRTACFQKDVISAIGGNFCVLDTDVLDSDMTANDNSTLTIRGTTTFSNGDILRIKDNTDDEWMEITDSSGAPTYVVTRDKNGDYAADTNPAWKKGATVVNYQQSSDGGIFMTASESNAPYLSVFTHSGSPWSDLTTRLRIGNLNGYLGYSSDKYGIAIGETTKYLKYDPTDGMQLKGNIIADSFVAKDSSDNTIFTVDEDGSANIITVNQYLNDHPTFYFSLRKTDSDAIGGVIRNYGLGETLYLWSDNSSCADPALLITQDGTGNFIDTNGNVFVVSKAGKVTCAGLDASTNKLENVTDPTSAQDAATKNYVDSITAISLVAGCSLSANTPVFKSNGNELNLIAEGANQSQNECYGATLHGQTFLTSAWAGQITKVSLGLQKQGAPSGNCVVSIRATSLGVPTGADLVSKTILASDITAGGLQEFEFSSPLSVTPNTTYAVLLYIPDGDGTNNAYTYRTNASTYSDGVYVTGSGESWSQYAYDFYFQVYEYPTSGKIYKTDASYGMYCVNFMGFTTESASKDDACDVQRNGVLGSFSGYTQGDTIYLSDTTGEISSSAGTHKYRVGIAQSATEISINEGPFYGRTISVSTNVFDGTSANSFTDLELGSYVGHNEAIVDLKVTNNTGGAQIVAFRTNGDSDDYYLSSSADDGGLNWLYLQDGDVGTIRVKTDSDGIIEWRTSTAGAVILTLKSYCPF